MSMSLRSFHLFFIAASTVLAVLVGVWGIQGWSASRNTSDLALGAFFLVVAIVLAIYGIRVRKKLRDLDPEE
ncbi:MAG TPA: hypothetical protein VF756_31945 [Thermoanaerobaculia bacterium]